MSTTPKIQIPEELISLTDTKLATIMRDIETKTEQKLQTIRQTESTISRPCDVGNTLIGIMSTGADEFKAKTGRAMTYSEMRQMYG